MERKMRLNITDLEAERKRREVMRIEHAARIGGALPKPEFQYDGERDFEISLGPIKMILWAELGQEFETKKTTVNVYKEDLERKLFELFPDKAVTKRLYDYIFEAMEKYVDDECAKLVREGETKFCG
jgi:hypothetical protein